MYQLKQFFTHSIASSLIAVFVLRAAFPPSPPPHVSARYPAVPECPQDIIQHQAGTTLLYIHRCLAHRSRHHSSGNAYYDIQVCFATASVLYATYYSHLLLFYIF